MDSPQNTNDLKLFAEDKQLASVDKAKWYDKLASEESLIKVKETFRDFKFNVHIVENKASALELLKTIPPKGASVMNPASTTLQEIGFVAYLKENTHGWNNLHEAILKEQDQAKAAQLRLESSIADYFITSACAIGEDGSIVVADLTGNRVAGVAAAKNVVVVVGSQKIVPSFTEALQRAEQFCLAVESARARVAYKVPGSAINNLLAIRGPNPFAPQQRFHIVIVKEHLGY